MPVPPPAPRPIPAPPAPKPAPPTPDSNKQGFKALAFVLVGAAVLMFVLLFAEMGREDAYYNYSPDDDGSYFYDDDYFEADWPSLEEAWTGDVVSFGSAQWRVLDKEPDALLLLLEDEMYLQPEEIDNFLNESELYYDVVYLAGMEFTGEEFGRIRPSPEGDALFLLSPEEMGIYGIEPPELWNDELIPVRPAIWVSVW